ncbi:glycoside hydrolase family 31 protein [Actinopolymorpha pittospori]|uniref:Alpha-glucosidase n=1 Tax=Actinopolymorpha pittospori TaxID=648752 RepID=A0A927MX53_9ACTN|nr:glycoside hydrolase family 31 protein [Actinopolymorpha pittospori]MBE1607904.1 alpha-glucosidase [Actinopolymorpha pittospori]
MQPTRFRTADGTEAVPPVGGGWLRHLRLRARESVFDRIRALNGSFQLVGWENSLRAVRYALYRGWLDRQLPEATPRPARMPGRLESAVEIPGGARFSFTVVQSGTAEPAVEPRPIWAGGTSRPTAGRTPATPRSAALPRSADRVTLEVQFLSGGGIFVGWNGAAPTPSYALGVFGERSTRGKGPAPAEDSRLGRAGEGWSVGAGDLTVTVDHGGGLTFRTTANVDTGGSGAGGSGTGGSDVGGTEARALRYDPPPRWEGDTWAHRSVLDSDAAVLGLGGRSARSDRQGRTYRLWNSDPGGTYALGDDPLSLSVPVYLVAADSGGHLVFYDNSHDGSIEVGEEVTTRLSGGPLRYYVFPGTPAQALDAYTALTGRPALPPRWALGYQQSRWGYGSQEAVRDVAAEFAAHDLPLSAMWLDIDHLDRHRPFNVDTRRYPDVGGLAATLGERGVHVVVIADPGVAKDRRDPVYRSGLTADVFCRDAHGHVVTGVVWPGATVFPDFTAQRTRDWWSGLYRTYTEMGVDGFWHDMNEPSVFAAWGDGTLPLSTRHDLDGRGGDHREAHNLYALLLNHAGFEGVHRLRPERRPFLLSRSGFAGLQRYAGTWSGDIGTSWEGLRMSLAFTIGLGCSGIPYSGPDIGGFDGHPGDELYVRWFELGAYLPFFRVHCAASLPRREPWALGPEVLAQVRPALRERYELMPYWYTLAWEAHRSGAPYVRPMLWADPVDAGLRWEDDQFLLGDALLVAPVLAEGERERRVRLPRGRWYDRRTGVAYDGPGHVSVPAPLDATPVLVRGGAVVPTERDGQITLEAYLPGPDDDAEPGGLLVTDAGDGFDEPVRERFSVDHATDGTPVVRYDGPAPALPYDVRWCGTDGS